ncbi:MAG: ABC transporter permease [Flavobacteriales bacterium]|nr:MAG: ABC transporter permease [Flavobacteriales bacterium]
MFITKFLEDIGRYFILMGEVFRRPDNLRMYWIAFARDLYTLGVKSLGLVCIISIFVGAVVTLQTALNLENPIIPKYYIAIATRESIILEFSPTMISLILAGKVVYNNASTLGTMRVSVQIDALEVMGVKSASYLIMPKIAACLIFNPVLIVLSMFLGIVGGYFAGSITGMISSTEFIDGLQMDYRPFYIYYALVKTVVFAFIITTVSAYYGYYVKGGAVEVGENSTKAVVSSSLVLIVANYIITQLLLS